MAADITETLEALSKGDLTLEEATEAVYSKVEAIVAEAVEEIGNIGTLDTYAMAALATVQDDGGADEIAERAFDIARACLRERARVLLELADEDDGEGDDD